MRRLQREDQVRAPPCIASCILTFGVHGEFPALIAVYQQRPKQTCARNQVRGILAVAVAGGPALALIRNAAADIGLIVTTINNTPAEPPVATHPAQHQDLPRQAQLPPRYL